MPKDFESQLNIKIREQIREIEKKIAESHCSEEKRRELDSEMQKLKRLLESTDSIYQM